MLQLLWDQWSWATKNKVDPKFREQVNVGSGDTAVKDIANDGDSKALK